MWVSINDTYVYTKKLSEKTERKKKAECNEGLLEVEEVVKLFFPNI